MSKSLSVFVLTTLFFISSVSPTIAGFRYPHQALQNHNYRTPTNFPYKAYQKHYNRTRAYNNYKAFRSNAYRTPASYPYKAYRNHYNRAAYHNYKAYRNHYYRSPAYYNYKAYRRHYYRTPPYSYYNYRNYYPYDNDYWTSVGVGFTTGAVFGSMLYRPYTPPTIIYTNPSPVVIYREPAAVYQQAPLPSANLSEQVLRRVETTAQLLNVRSGPGTSSAITDQIQRGTRLDVIGVAPGWLYVRTLSGHYGWVSAQYTRDINGPAG